MATISGTYNLTAQPNIWKNTANQRVELECNTSSAAVTINLPLISALNGFHNVLIAVSDLSNNAAVNNITINANGSDTIDNAASVIINTSGASCVIGVSADGKWICVEDVVASSAPTPAYSPIVARLSNIDLSVKADNIFVWESGKSVANTCNYRILVKEVGAGSSYVERGQTPSTSASTNLNLIGFPSVATDVYILFNGNVITKMSKVLYASISDFIDGLTSALYASNTGFGGGNNSPQLTLSSPIGAFYNGKSFDIVANSPYGLSYLGAGITLNGGADGDSAVVQLKINDRFYAIQNATSIQNSLDLRYLQRNYLNYTGSVVGINGSPIFEWGDWNLKVLQELAQPFPVDVILMADTI